MFKDEAEFLQYVLCSLALAASNLDVEDTWVFYSCCRVRSVNFIGHEGEISNRAGSNYVLKVRQSKKHASEPPPEADPHLGFAACLLFWPALLVYNPQSLTEVMFSSHSRK
nr:uncharacterized protein LOC109027070 [Gorilla gorilla gorilla]